MVRICALQQRLYISRLVGSFRRRSDRRHQVADFGRQAGPAGRPARGDGSLQNHTSRRYESVATCFKGEAKPTTVAKSLGRSALPPSSHCWYMELEAIQLWAGDGRWHITSGFWGWPTGFLVRVLSVTGGGWWKQSLLTRAVFVFLSLSRSFCSETRLPIAVLSARVLREA